jgi:hypothetical protein
MDDEITRVVGTHDEDRPGIRYDPKPLTSGDFELRMI